MSSEKNIKVYFKTKDDKVSLEVDVNKTVDRMIADFLEKRNLIEKMNDFIFIVNSIPLTKDKFINKKIKYIRQIKPDCIIQVRYIR